ncbi:cellulose synthase [Rhodobacteraceae bacterium DSL-40]|uniref:cellulose synthase n=1 Tax=Amaricoccus sp. B4 TaxID=3368557 RepID=UPI000DAD4FBC
MPLTAGFARDRALALALLLALPLPAAAEQMDGAGKVAEAQETINVDESALRYFARQGDMRRLNAEIERLKALYPGWRPPADPLALPPGGDPRIEAMWRLFAEGRYAEVRDAIAKTQAEDPDWTPPEDLLNQLAAGETRTRLVNASDLKQYGTVVRVATENPELLTCADTDVLWRVAEAFAETGKGERAKDAYSYVLENCENPDERLATMQKAMNELRRPMMVDLLSLEHTQTDGRGEFDSIRDELARRAVAEGNADAKLSVEPADLTRVAALFETKGDVHDALLLGWYHLQREQISEASTWFEKAHGVEDTAVGAQGLALTQIAEGQFASAEATMAPWRDDSDAARSVYLAASANLLAGDPPAVLDEAVLQRMVPAVLKAQDAATARQLGWYARAFKQEKTAEQWFVTALGWNAGDEDAAYGLGLTRVALGDSAGLKALKSDWSGKSERIAALGVPARGGSGGGGGAARVTDCTRYVNPASLSAGSALARGWCLLDANRAMDAAAAFGVALGSSSAKTRSDAAYGQSLAYLRAGLVDQAAAAATRATQSEGRSEELMSSILSERATAAYNRGRYRETLEILDHRASVAPEQVDLMVLRGYSLYNLRRYHLAEKVFEAAARSGNAEAARGLKLTRAAKRNPR